MELVRIVFKQLRLVVDLQRDQRAESPSVLRMRLASRTGTSELGDSLFGYEGTEQNRVRLTQLVLVAEALEHPIEALREPDGTSRGREQLAADNFDLDRRRLLDRVIA